MAAAIAAALSAQQSSGAPAAPASAAAPAQDMDPGALAALEGNRSGYGLGATAYTLPTPNSVSGSSVVTIGAYPAQVAGLLGPLGIAGLCANVTPTRILVVRVTV